MKGPYQRVKHDLRRTWECPVCHHRLRTVGKVTSQLCKCQEQKPPGEMRWMRLVEENERKVTWPKGDMAMMGFRKE